MMKIPTIVAILMLLTVAGPTRAAKTDPSGFEVVDRAGLDRTALDEIESRLGAQYQRAIDFLAVEDPGPKIKYTIYPSFEAKGLATTDMRLGHTDYENGAVHVVVNEWVRGDDGMNDTQLLIRRHLGEPATHLLEVGLAVYFTQNWRGLGREYAYWAGRLHASGNTPSLRDLLDNEIMPRESYLVVQPLAATFVAYAIEVFGRDVFLEQYPGWTAKPGEIASLERGWHKYLDDLVSRQKTHTQRDRDAFPRRVGFQKGFCHAHMGYEIFNGYGSRKSDDALARLSDLGTNAVSITPFTFQRDPLKPVRFRFSNAPGAENDESVIHSARTARELGMRVMLKPHVWLGRSWPGAIEMQSEADWDLWFEYYYRWILHYAVLAEMYEIDILCIGVELCKTTVGHEDRWRSIIARLRGIYSGEMTYAANWGEEFENVAIWSDLDFIGINCYYPLSDAEEPTHEALCKGMETIVERIRVVQRRYDKSVVFTEIGFTSTQQPWLQPHQPRVRVVNLDHQAMCYEAVFETLYGESWCGGIYWWKWPSFLEYGGSRNSGFTPNQKPAEQIVRTWYGRTW